METVAHRSRRLQPDLGSLIPETVNLKNRAMIAEYELFVEEQHVRKVYRAVLADLLRRQPEGTTTGMEPLEYEHGVLQHLVLGEG